MKKTLITITTFIALGAIALAGGKGNKSHKKQHKYRKGDHIEKKAVKASIREEALLDKIDTHSWKKDPGTRDHRSENIREYTHHTYQRIVKLGTWGALEEEDQRSFKTSHAQIVTFAKKANDDGLSEDEVKSIRKQLDTLNNSVNDSIKEPEAGDNRSPLVNKAQHQFDEKIEYGIRSGRLSTLEASSLRRKVSKLEKLEDRLKTGNGLSSSDRERLMKEAHEVQRELSKELRD